MLCKCYANAMQTLCKPHANAMQTEKYSNWSFSNFYDLIRGKTRKNRSLEAQEQALLDLKILKEGIT